MPEFEWADVTGIVTTHTLLAAVCGGLLLAVFLWSTPPRVLPGSIGRIYVCGLSFLVLMAAGRWAALSPHWESWFGTALLWTVFLATASAAIGARRWYGRVRHPGQPDGTVA